MLLSREARAMPVYLRTLAVRPKQQSGLPSGLGVAVTLAVWMGVVMSGFEVRLRPAAS
jgi:hypothetical protein